MAFDDRVIVGVVFGWCFLVMVAGIGLGMLFC